MKNKKMLSNIAWKGAIMLCVIICLFGLVFTSCTNYRGSDPFVSEKVDREDKESNKDKDKENNNEENSGDELTDLQIPVGPQTQEPTETAEPSPTPEYTGVTLRETEDAGREYLDKFVFIGDSTTYGIGYYYRQGYTELCPPEQVWTPSSGTLALFNYSIATVVYPETGEEIPIADAVAAGKPEYLLLTIGVNGVSSMDEEWFVRDYKSLIDIIKEASPDTKIILNSIYPVAKSYQHIDSISNEKIAAANGWIKKIAEDTGLRYLNTYEILVGSDGALPEDKHNGDGIHLSGETFEEVMEYIRTHAAN